MSEQKSEKKVDLAKAMDMLQAVALKGGLEVAEKQVILAVAEENPEDYVAGLEAVQHTLAGVDRRIERMKRDARPQVSAQEHAAQRVDQIMADTAAQNAARLFALLEEVNLRALELGSGHVTILKFTTDWKVAFGTPDFDGSAQSSRKWLWDAPGFDTLSEALDDLLATNRRWPSERELKGGPPPAKMADGRTLAEVAHGAD